MNHDKMMKAIHDIFDPALPRLAPGDHHSTRRALEILYGPDLAQVGEGIRVLDVGCGNGAQTLSLAAELGCRITAVDNHRPYLDELERRAAAKGLGDRIETLCLDMKDLDLDGRTFDLVWAEGSIFIMGVPEGLRAWREFLKPGGAVGFTELVWLRDGVPDECREFFAAIYPPMAEAATHLATIRDCGYDLAGRFTLPESDWLENFYDHLEKRLAGYVPPDDEEETQAVLSMATNETDMYRRFSRWYGYEFFLLRRPG